MTRFFSKKNEHKDKKQEQDDGGSSVISEELHLPAPDQSPQEKSSVWNNLPELALTTTDDSRQYKPVDMPRSPSVSSLPAQIKDNVFLDIKHDHRHSTAFSIKNDGLSIDGSSVSDDHTNLHSSTQPFKDTASFVSVESQVNSLNNDHHKQNTISVEDSAANTLIEAAMDQDEAKDRHIGFQEHVAESAALVEHMLKVKFGHLPSQDPIGHAMTTRHDNRDEEDMEMTPTHQPQIGGGSVLASLMKLEVQRKVGEEKQKKKKKKKALKVKTNKQKKPRSLYDYPVHYETDPHLADSADTLTVTPRPKRPALINRPTSWLSEMTANKYVVPSLEKKKKSAAPSFSRRFSNDSMFTTASQFEPITLEDRIRITFEIANILQKHEFLVKLCKSLMLYGCPAHRLEFAMRQVSRTLGVNAEYVYIPNVMLVTFIDSSTHTTETHFIRQNSTFEMHRLADIYRLEKLVAHGEVSVDEALEFIDKVANQPPIYPTWLQPFSYALASFAGCVLFFGGRWKEAGVAAALGMVFATNEIFSTFIASFQPIWEITVCILIGFVARGIQKYDFCFTPIGFSSFIIVLPGYPMTVGIIELVSRQVVSGVIRMVYAIIYSFLLGYGVSMGSELYMTMDKSTTTQQTQVCQLASNASTCISSESQWFNFLLVPLFALAYCVFLRARPPRWIIMIGVSACTYVINYSLACWAGAPSQILQVVPAFGLGLLGNLLSKFTGKMSFDAMLLGVFYLVPSSLGIKAAYGVFSGTDEVASQGADFALSMIESAIGISLGLFLATLVVYPKGTQHTPLMTL